MASATVVASTEGGAGPPNEGWNKGGGLVLPTRDHVLAIIRTPFVFFARVRLINAGRRHPAPRGIIKSHSGCKSEIFFF